MILLNKNNYYYDQGIKYTVYLGMLLKEEIYKVNTRNKLFKIYDEIINVK